MKVSSLIIIAITVVGGAFAQNEWNYIVAKEQIAAEAERTKIYAAAIVISGALIGAGLYLGLRGRKQNPKS